MSGIAGAATFVKVTNSAGVVMRFRTQTPFWEGSENSGTYPVGQSATVRPFDGLHGREMWPRALIDFPLSSTKTCDPSASVPHIVFDRYCGATARYSLKGSYFDPYFVFDGLDGASAVPPAQSVANMDHLVGKELRISTYSAVSPARWLLSASVSGKVDLWTVDDNSGRQRWIVEKLTTPAKHYRIRVARGTNSGETYLSCTEQYAVDLFDTDDASGHQHWRFVTTSNGRLAIQPYRPALPLGSNLDAYPNYLSCSKDGSVVDLFGDQDGSNRQLWKVETV